MENNSKKYNYISKIINDIKSFLLCDEIQKVDVALFFIIFLICFLFFNHYDTTCTTMHANKLLECVFTGKFDQFYSIVNGPWINDIGRDYSLIANTPIEDQWLLCPAVYPLITYVSYAIWNLGPFLINFITHKTVFNTFFFLMWSKVFIVICNAVISYFIYKIILKVKDKKTARLGTYLYVTSGPLLFASIVFNQLDAIYLMFIVIGLYFLVNKNRLDYFALFIGIASSYKYIPLLIGLAIIPLYEKKPFNLLKNYLIMLFPIVLISLIAGYDDGYTKSMQLGDFSNKLFVNGITVGKYSLYFLVPCSIFGMVIGYLTKINHDNYFHKTVLLSTMMLTAFYVFVSWNPQWILSIIPFLIFILCISNNKWMSFCLEFLFIIGYLLFTLYAFSDCNVNENMIKWGILGQINGLEKYYAFELKNLFDYYLPFSSVVIRNLLFTMMITGLIGLQLFNLNPRLNASIKQNYYRWMLYLRGLMVLVLFCIPAFWSYLRKSHVYNYDISEYKNGNQEVAYGINGCYISSGKFIVNGWAYKNNDIAVNDESYIILIETETSYCYKVTAASVCETKFKYDSWKRKTGFEVVVDVDSFLPGNYQVYIGYEFENEKYLVSTSNVISF